MDLGDRKMHIFAKWRFIATQEDFRCGISEEGGQP